MKTIYFISGLGADKSIFQKLELRQLQPRFIEWIPPSKNETMEAYAQKLLNQIDLSEPFVLLGVSFGGMIAVEIAKITSPDKTFLISSAKKYTEIPFLYRLMGKLGLHKLLPSAFLKWANPITYFFFGGHEEDEKKLLKNILKKTDAHFMKWAIDQIVNWKNTDVPENIVQIHGTHDRILPCLETEEPILLANTGHLMIYQEAAQVSQIINEIVVE